MAMKIDLIAVHKLMMQLFASFTNLSVVDTPQFVIKVHSDNSNTKQLCFNFHFILLMGI